MLKKAKNRLLTRAAQKRARVVAAAYGGAAITIGTLFLAGCGMFPSKEPPQRQAGQMTVGDATASSSSQAARETATAPSSPPVLSAEAVPPPAVVERPLSSPPRQQLPRREQPPPAYAAPQVYQPPAPQEPAVSIPQPPSSPPPAQQQYDIPIPSRVPAAAAAAQEPATVSRPQSGPADIPAPPENRILPRNVTPPVPLAYGGPRSGVLNWSGQLEKNGTIVLQGDQASAGTLNGRLPGIPVMVELDTREFALAEAPGPSNNWSKLVIRSKNKRHTVVSIKWSVLQ